MKNNIITKLSIALFAILGGRQAQAQTLVNQINVDNLPIIFMGKEVNIHIIAPEPIQFVDLSTNYLIGDLPSENIARIKVEQSGDELMENATQKKELRSGMDIGIITVVGQSFLAQYRAIYQEQEHNWLASNIHIKAEDMQPLEYPKLKYSNYELKRFALDIQAKKIKKPIRKKKNLKLKMLLNNVYVIDDYIFLDISIENLTNLPCNIDAMKFSIEDKKIYKATNNQSILLTPLYALNNQTKIRKNYRNIFVFEKFTFPNSKILKIRLIEEQISGRVIDMKVNYSDVLQADTF
jgi:conjugative transposon TraN protein